MRLFAFCNPFQFVDTKEWLVSSSVAVLALFLLTQLASASERQPIEQILSSIKTYRVASPIKAKQLLIDNAEFVESLSISNQLQWHYSTVVVSNQLDDTELATRAFKAMADIFDRDQGAEFKPVYLNYLGHFALKHGSYATAFDFYHCSIDGIADPRQLFSPIYSIAMIAMYDGDYESVEMLLNSLDTLAIRFTRKDWRSDINNAFGVMSLYKKDHIKAQRFFKEAMDQYFKDANRNGELIASVNTLLASILVNDGQSLVGIKDRVDRLADLQQSADIMILLKWLILLEKRMFEGKSNIRDIQQLKPTLNDVQNSAVLKAISDFILPYFADSGESFDVINKFQNLLPDATLYQFHDFAQVVGCKLTQNSDSRHKVTVSLNELVKNI